VPLNLPDRSYPSTRMRRNRHAPWVRRLVAENKLSGDDLIWPVFVIDGDNKTEPVASMPGVARYSIDLLIDAVGEAKDLGIPAVAIFPQTNPEVKNPEASEAYNPENLVCRAVRAIKAAHPDIGVMCDVALDPYNSDGHDGLVSDGRILNDETIEILCKQSLVQAEAGCDILGPSDMMDGRVAAMRSALDSAGFGDTIIMSYAAKYASGFYDPFRDAVGSGGALKGDKKTYQMDFANTDEAIREVAKDLLEGADMVMIKPGMPYLDVCQRVKFEFGVPTFAYQVSGEYAMICAAGQNGWIDQDKAMIESLGAFKRAGCDGVLTYFANRVARMLLDEEY